MLNSEYAEMIARDWNTNSHSYAGFVTKFEIDDDYAGQFEVHTVGSRICQELRVPAEELERLNAHIVGKITVEAAYYGDEFDGDIDPTTNLPVGFKMV